ncbi:MAG: Uma2 family endonuclease [bacterium]|nr:Uma2 family endonuclease [bacterium]
MHDRLIPERIRLNYTDYCALPDDGKRYQILDGVLHVSPSPRTIHQRVVFRLGRMLAGYAESHDLGEILIAPMDVLLGDEDIVQPDVIFISRANAAIITEDNIKGVPDLLIEVLSPTRPELDTRDKRQVYARCGVPFYWLVDPVARTLTELELVDEDYGTVVVCQAGDTFSPRLWPDLSIDLNKLWMPPR